MEKKVFDQKIEELDLAHFIAKGKLAQEYLSSTAAVPLPPKKGLLKNFLPEKKEVISSTGGVYEHCPPTRARALEILEKTKNEILPKLKTSTELQMILLLTLELQKKFIDPESGL